jgi:hypothetical protein
MEESSDLGRDGSSHGHFSFTETRRTDSAGAPATLMTLNYVVKYFLLQSRSPDRPNPLGLHPVTVRRIDGNRLRIGPIEAIDCTPVVDIKPVLGRSEL